LTARDAFHSIFFFFYFALLCLAYHQKGQALFRIVIYDLSFFHFLNLKKIFLGEHVRAHKGHCAVIRFLWFIFRAARHSDGAVALSGIVGDPK
jgi:hypothetical protein